MQALVQVYTWLSHNKDVKYFSTSSPRWCVTSLTVSLQLSTQHKQNIRQQCKNNYLPTMQILYVTTHQIQAGISHFCSHPSPLNTTQLYTASKMLRMSKMPHFPYVDTNRYFEWLKRRTLILRDPKCTVLTFSLLMYIHGAPCKARNFNVVYIYGPTFGNAESRLFLYAAQYFNNESMQKVILCHNCV
jgi:hypothetical protein